MNFLAARWLWLLLAVAGLIAAYVWVQVRGRRKAAVRFTNLALLASVAPKRPGWQRHIGAGLLALALAGMVVALARPLHDVKVPRRRALVVMAIDVSVSMKATDVAPSRLAAAKAAAEEFARSLPDSVQLGLVSFAGHANVVVTPTTDHVAVIQSIEALQLQEATAIGEAVITSLDAIRASGIGVTGSKAPATIVLMSDGTTTVGTPNATAAAEAQQAKVPVTTIAFGTDTGIVEYQGRTVSVPVNRPELADLASTTGGKAFTAETAGELEAAYRNISTAVGYTHEKREATTAVLGVALVLGLLAAAASLRWTSRLP
ncbi:MAG: von Willebrand factor type [Acidimicrobiales bacterium]|nr:von Willebrand factor type [Acidimicrobiales bacterium]